MADKNKNVEVRTGGISFLGMLTILFIALKLTGHINWSWWLVTLPLWAVPGLIVGVLLLAMVFWTCCWLVNAISDIIPSRRSKR